MNRPAGQDDSKNLYQTCSSQSVQVFTRFRTASTGSRPFLFHRTARLKAHSIADATFRAREPRLANSYSPITNHTAFNSPSQPAPPADPASNRAPVRRASRRPVCRRCGRGSCGRFYVGWRVDGAESCDQVLFFDGVLGIVGVVWDVGRDEAFFDFRRGNFWGVARERVVAGRRAVGSDETFAVSGAALDRVIVTRKVVVPFRLWMA